MNWRLSWALEVEGQDREASLLSIQPAAFLRKLTRERWPLCVRRGCFLWSGVRLDCGQVRASFCRLAHFHFDSSQHKTSIEFNYAITQLSRLSDDGTAGESIAVVGTAVENNAAYFINNGSNYTTLTAENGAQSSSGALVLETIGDHFGGACKIDVSGNLTCSGKVAGVVGH